VFGERMKGIGVDERFRELAEPRPRKNIGRR
jgi:hypothetical protein